VEVLASLLPVTYYVVTGLYAVVATCIASSCLVAVGTVLVRHLVPDNIETLTYPA